MQFWVYDGIFKPTYNVLFEKKPHAIAPLGIRMKQHMCDIGIDMKHIAVQRLPSIPLGCLKPGTFNFDLQLLGNKSEVAPHIFISKYSELVSEYKNYMKIFTDGSKYDTKVAAAAVYENNICASRLPDKSSIFSAEIHAINLALNLIKDHNGNKFIIFSDSLSSLIAIQNRLWDNILVLETLEKIHNLTVNGKTVVFVWLPSHIGIKGMTLIWRRRLHSLQHQAIYKLIIIIFGNIFISTLNQNGKQFGTRK